MSSLKHCGCNIELVRTISRKRFNCVKKSSSERRSYILSEQMNHLISTVKDLSQRGSISVKVSLLSFLPKYFLNFFPVIAQRYYMHYTMFRSSYLREQ